MPRALRHFLPGHIWQITHRCLNREFFFDQKEYRTLWIDWLSEAKVRSLNEDYLSYGEWNNKLEWEIELDNVNDIKA